MPESQGIDFIINKSDWNQSRFVETQVSHDLAPGQVLFRVERFAFTANNITYAMAGDMLSYWHFFPTEEGWGRLPTMGMADVIASTHDGVAEGTRCFGFFPMSKHLLIEPATANPGSIIDGVAHRKNLAMAYNQYQPVQNDALYASEYEDELMLLRGLYMTSFLAEDFLSDSDLYGAESVLISSASSKTSIAMAFRVAEKGEAKAIGLTSSGNLDFVKGLGFYDEVISYDDIAALPQDVPAVFVDMAGNTAVTRQIHEHLGENLKYSQRIGGTHWESGGGDDDMPGPQREFFFAPGQIQKRIADWGAQGFQERLGSSLQAFVESSKRWLDVERGYGRDAVERVYHATLENRARPNQGNILSLWEDEDSASGR